MDDLHQWDVTPKEAVQVQHRLRSRVRLADNFSRIRTVAGIDISVGRGSKQGRCAVVVLSLPELEVVERRVIAAAVRFPYVPGLLAWREVPIFLQAYELLDTKPDLLFFDGQGYAHPRRFGLACCGGLVLDKPSIGCAKSRLIGEYDPPPMEAGSTSPLTDQGERIGDVVRTKAGVKPVFVSPGHHISFESAARITLECTRGHRIPEPTRLAHIAVTSRSAYPEP